MRTGQDPGPPASYPHRRSAALGRRSAAIVQRPCPSHPSRRTWSPFSLSPTRRSSPPVRPDGSPHTAATWYLWVDGRVLVNVDDGRRRLEHLRQEPRVSLTVLGREDWYHQVTLRGHVAELVPDPQFTDIDRLSEHYTGQAYPQRDRVRAWIEVTAWHARAVIEPWTGGR